ncbi:hypothetical protein [Streptomyces avermitilis]|uniref:hypothetical protein n=1 Tax=Streptomyces avermitilis TaxID=33903 RepID=UPI0033F84129
MSGFYPTAHRTGPQEPVRPDGLYGVSKAAIEAVGRLYADKFDVSVICLRIGSFEEAPTESRHLATWLSPRDAVGFCRAALRTPNEKPSRSLLIPRVPVRRRRPAGVRLLGHRLPLRPIAR